MLKEKTMTTRQIADAVHKQILACDALDPEYRLLILVQILTLLAIWIGNPIHSVLGSRLKETWRVYMDAGRSDI